MTGESHRHSPESPFWRFSLRFYGRPGVADACLSLQDQAGADVNLLLFLLFLAERKRQLDAAEIARFDAAVSQWRDSVVKPLRALRRGLKPGIEFIPGTVIETFRAQIKRLELEVRTDRATPVGGICRQRCRFTRRFTNGCGAIQCRRLLRHACECPAGSRCGGPPQFCGFSSDRTALLTGRERDCLFAGLCGGYSFKINRSVRPSA